MSKNSDMLSNPSYIWGIYPYIPRRTATESTGREGVREDGRRGLHRSADVEIGAMESDNAGSKPELVCAPCWICLEDGPDENGEPLVRDCACRGETSAGYHLSCLIDYAKSRTDEAVDVMKEGKKEIPPFYKPWVFCPNCSQMYKESVRLPLVYGFVATTKNLSETNIVRFEAKMTLIAALISSFRGAKEPTHEPLTLAENEITALFEIVNEKPGDLTRSMVSNATPILIERNRARHSSRLFSFLGDIKWEMGDKETALKMFEQAEQVLDYYNSFGFGDGSRNKQDIVKSIKELKKEMGLVQVTAAEEISLRRGELKDLIEGGGSVMNVVCAKMALAIALCDINPPQFLEAMQLTKAAFDTSRQVFGPDSRITVELKRNLDKMTEDYRDYLEYLQRMQADPL